MADTRHILMVSGGKDSTALAIYMRDRVPQMEYVFCDTGEELPETYEYIDKLESYLGKPIVRLKPAFSFDEYLERRGGFLPSLQMRWCTRLLKILPFEKYVGKDPVYSYIGIRADEHRKGYIARKSNIIPKYPFIEDDIDLRGVLDILEKAGIGLPRYYEWRTRSGCYFCFFQRPIEWIGLMERHPKLFERAMQYEKASEPDGRVFTWRPYESLADLARPERVMAVKKRAIRSVERERTRDSQQKMVLDSDLDLDPVDEYGNLPCLACSL